MERSKKDRNFEKRSKDRKKIEKRSKDRKIEKTLKKDRKKILGLMGLVQSCPVLSRLVQIKKGIKVQIEKGNKSPNRIWKVNER